MPVQPAGALVLSRRQVEVIRLLARSSSAKQIAKELGLAVPTVKTHLAAAYAKLGCRKRRAAIVEARARGYLE